MGDGVYVAGVGMIRFDKHPDKSVKQMTAEAVTELSKDVSFDLDDVEAVWFSNSGWGMSEFQHCIRGQVALAPLGLQGIPIMNVENACAGGSTAIHGAWTAVTAGLYDVVLAVGTEKVWYPQDKKRMFEGFMSGTDVEFSRMMIEMFKADAKKKAAESGASGAEKKGGHSGFMDIYAMGARMHMDAYGTTQRQLAVIASKNRRNGSLNPLAQFQQEMSVDEVMEDVMVAYPLTRAMCAPVGDGSAAALICSERGLSRLAGARPVRIRASVLASGSLPEKGLPGISRRASERAYEKAGLGPDDIDVVEVHDATAFGELTQCEDLGLCPEGEGGPYAESGATAIGGSRPVNPSGGLECRGHPIGASGIAQVYELTTQLRGDAGPRQVEGARVAMAENGGGFIGMGEAAMCIHVLEKVENGVRPHS